MKCLDEAGTEPRLVPSGRSPAWTLDPYAEAFYERPIALTQEGRSLVDDVCDCVHDWRVRKGWVGVSNLLGTYNVPLLGVAYCLA